jgi:DNA repair protein RecO (recombination protein O)
MLQTTRGIILRSVKYGETSLICTIFTELYGVQTYMIQGVRTTEKNKQNRAGLLQPATLLDLVVYQKPGANLQRIKEYHPAYIYTSLQEHVVKNSVALFSVELLLRLLPEHAPMPELFDSCFEYFRALDKALAAGNYPIYFLVHCANMLGYNISGSYSEQTPHLNLQEGGFSHNMPPESRNVTTDDAKMLDRLLKAESVEEAANIEMNGGTRFRLLDWLVAFMHLHTQHMGEIRSLQVLRTILHS